LFLSNRHKTIKNGKIDNKYLGLLSINPVEVKSATLRIVKTEYARFISARKKIAKAENIHPLAEARPSPRPMVNFWYRVQSL